MLPHVGTAVEGSRSASYLKVSDPCHPEIQSLDKFSKFVAIRSRLQGRRSNKWETQSPRFGDHDSAVLVGDGLGKTGGAGLAGS